MEIKAYIKHQKIPAKKLRFLLDDIKTKTPVNALNHLYYGKRRSASILYKAIKSAVDNAKNTFKIDENLLKFKLLTVEQGPALKRHTAGSRGSAKPFKRRTSHIKIVLVAQTPTVKKIKEENLPKTDKKENIEEAKVIEEKNEIKKIEKKVTKSSVKKVTVKKTATKTKSSGEQKK